MFDLGVLVWLVGAGIFGFTVVSLGIGSPVSRNKHTWLLQHFGKAGRDRWIRNQVLVHQWEDCSRKGMHWAGLGGNGKPYGPAYQAYQQAQAVMERSKILYGADCFNKAYRASDGSCRGLVVDGAQARHSLNYKNRPPWGTGWYKNQHNEPTEHEHIWNRCHGEPRGTDWLAAGFWDKIQRDDGVMVDPINVWYNDMMDYWLQYGRPDTVVVGCDAVYARAEKIARKRSLYEPKFEYELNS